MKTLPLTTPIEVILSNVPPRRTTLCEFLADNEELNRALVETDLIRSGVFTGGTQPEFTVRLVQPDKATARPLESLILNLEAIQNHATPIPKGILKINARCLELTRQAVNENAALNAVADYARELVAECIEVGRASHLCLDHSTIQNRFEKLLANLAAFRGESEGVK